MTVSSNRVLRAKNFFRAVRRGARGYSSLHSGASLPKASIEKFRVARCASHRRTEPAAAHIPSGPMTSQHTSLSEQHVTRHARHTIPPRPLGCARCPPSPCPARHFKPGPAAILCLEAGPTLARQQRAGIPRPWASPHAGGRSTTRATAHPPPPARPPVRLSFRPTTELAASLRAGCSSHDADKSLVMTPEVSRLDSQSIIATPFRTTSPACRAAR